MALGDGGVLELAGEYQARYLRLQCLSLAAEALKPSNADPAQIVDLAARFYDFVFLGETPS